MAVIAHGYRLCRLDTRIQIPELSCDELRALKNQSDILLDLTFGNTSFIFGPSWWLMRREFEITLNP